MQFLNEAGVTMQCIQEWNRIGGEPQLLEVQSMLRTALQNSSCDGDEFADRLFIVQSGFDVYNQGLRNPFLAFSKHHHTLGTFVDCNSKFHCRSFVKFLLFVNCYSATP